MSKHSLEEIGFISIGHWSSSPRGIACALTSLQDASPALYAFVVGERIKYIGKTTRKLRDRLAGYANPGESQRTNLRVRKLIQEALSSGEKIEIMGFVNEKPQHIGRFVLNISAGLEDSIISELRPDWNGASQNSAEISAEKAGNAKLSEEIKTAVRTGDSHSVSEGSNLKFRPSFNVQVGKTYYNKGFFNLGIDSDRYIGKNGTSIAIGCGNALGPIEGRIDRTANSNGSPRIHAGANLARWFQSNMKQGQYVKVIVLNPNSIQLDTI